MVYVDDDSDSVHDADPVILRNLIQQESENSADWLSDNRLCVAGDKTKLLVIGTRQLRNQKLNDTEMKITVDGQEVVETGSEKLLGVVLNNELTWKAHLYGDEDNEGLVPQLSKRVGILKQLAKYMSKQRLKQFASGIFYSKLSYCLPVFGNVLGLEEYKEENNRYTSYTTSDNHRLQVIQNKVNRLLTGARYDTPTSELLKKTDSLSVQQMIAFQTILMTFKIQKFKKPVYLAERLEIRPSIRNLRGGASVNQPNSSLSIKKEGFICRGQALMNKLDLPLRKETSIDVFKIGLRDWVKKNIEVKPKPRFQTFQSRIRRPPPAPPQQRPPATPTRNMITNYFMPQARQT